MKRIYFLSFLLILMMFSSNKLMVAQTNNNSLAESAYPYWGDYHKTPISEIRQAVWIGKDTVTNGWDWSLPDFVEPSAVSKLCIIRNFSLGSNKINEIPEVNFPANPVISHWVKWRELEPTEGNINFQPLINNINKASQKGYGSIVRIHFSAIDFAPDWIKKYNIPIREEKKENPKKTNYEVSHPEFHSRYLKFIKALGESGIPQMEEVQGLFLGYASPSNGDEGIGPYGEGNPDANDTVQHVIERIDAWADACNGVEYKVFMGGLSNYGFSKGFGIRRGFVEMYLYHIPDEHIGQKLDSDNYLYVDETSTVIAKNVFQGEENEEYEEKWSEGQSSSRFGALESFPYRYFTANLRLLQMRCNYLLNNEFALLPEMLSWVSLEMGRTIEDAPDAWCFLRESYIKENGGRPVKNFERWLYQRDAPGYETEPAVKIEQAIQMWMVQSGKYYDFIARQGKKIGFDIEDSWTGLKDSIAIKISYFDNHAGELNLVYNNGQQEIKKPLALLGDNSLKTATFFISKLKANGLDQNFDFILEAGENTENITVSFVRVVHADVTSGQLGAAKKVFPDKAWGVYSWTQFTQIDKNNAPLAKGGPIIARWENLEPQNGVYTFDKEIKDKLTKALDNDFYTFIKIYFAGPGSGFTPEWIYNSGVPKVTTTRGSFPYYFDDDYKVFYYRMIEKFGEYVLSLPNELKERILFIQCTEGSTGDGYCYKGDNIPAEYDISRTAWTPFRLEAWKKFKAAFSVEDELQIPLLTNDDANTPELRTWMLNELPMAIGVKNGMFTHGYQISDAQERLANHFTLKEQAEAAGKVFFARGEMDAEMNEKGWITQNKKQGLYWSGIYATHCGITMWNMPQDAVKGDEYADAINFFNKYAGQLNPETAKGAFCAFYRGLDASDVTTFPENIYGTASKSNTQRYIKICNAFSKFGANMADPAAATGGGMVNRDASGYNDAGWQILKENLQRHITQIDPEETSVAWWQVDDSVYGRFARGFDAENGKDSMFFDLNDGFLGNQQAVIAEVTYLDSDLGSWKLMYDAKGDSLKTAMTITNTGSGGWKTTSVTLNDVYLENRGPRAADFILVNTGGTDCRFHMIAIEKTEKTVIPGEETTRTTFQNIPWQFPKDTLQAWQYDYIQNIKGETLFSLDSSQTIGIYGCNDNSGINIRAYNDAVQNNDAAQFNWDSENKTFQKNGQWIEYSAEFNIDEPYQLILRARNNMDAHFKITVFNASREMVFYKDVSLKNDFENLGRGNEQTDWYLSKFALTDLWGAYVIRFDWYDQIGESGIFGEFSFIESNLDITPPQWYFVTVGDIVRGTDVVVMTTEAANVYLVSAETASDKDSIEKAALAEAEVYAYTQGKLATSGLPDGNYVVYAIDDAGNISEASKLITIENPVSTEVLANIPEIKVKYNSTDEKIEISSSAELRLINIFNILGNQVASKILNGTACAITTSKLYSGIYLVQVYDWKQNMERTKIFIE